MDIFLTIMGVALLYFAFFGLPETAKIIMNGKVKIAEANRDAKKYELETARINSIN